MINRKRDYAPYLRCITVPRSRCLRKQLALQAATPERIRKKPARLYCFKSLSEKCKSCTAYSPEQSMMRWSQAPARLLDSTLRLYSTSPPPGSRAIAALPKGEATHHLFARSRTLRIKLTCGFGISIVLSISPLHAVLDYCLALTDFHGVPRAESPNQLT